MRFFGQAIERLAPRERLKLGIGFVPQGRCNFPLMTVRENLELGAYTLPALSVGRGRAILVYFAVPHRAGCRLF